MNKNIIIAIVLGALILIAIFQTFQLLKLKTSMVRGSAGPSCTANTPQDSQNTASQVFLYLFLALFWNSDRQKHKY